MNKDLKRLWKIACDDVLYAESPEERKKAMDNYLKLRDQLDKEEKKKAKKKNKKKKKKEKESEAKFDRTMKAIQTVGPLALSAFIWNSDRNLEEFGHMTRPVSKSLLNRLPIKW